MKLAILCLCLASTACAAPFNFSLSRQQVPPPLPVNSHFAAGFPHTGLPGGYSVELIYPHRFPGVAGGSNPAQPFSSFGLIKYSIPQPPGRQSVEVFYAYDFAQQRIIPNIPPMTNVPVVKSVHLFSVFQISPFGANALPSQDPPKLHPQDQPIQTSQVTIKRSVFIVPL
uniref:Secretory calcium-binding phosphoprotein 5 n=1 Tax=Amphilophus citrinellus TaxID=61819 RepID=A0A3Q0QYA2_AMPCI